MMVVSPLAQAVIVHSALENMRRRPADLGTSFQFSIRRSVPLIGASIIYNVSVVLGFLALVVPGFMAMTVWFVAMPACLVEQTGSIASLKRSAQLTKSHRWKIFSVVLVMTLILSIVGGLLFTLSAVMSFLPPVFSNDGTSLDTNAAVLLLEGRNP